MAVVLPDGTYQVATRPHPFALDSHGVAVPAALGAYGPARPGAARLQPDLSWRLRLSPDQWPLEAGDKVTGGPDTLTWTVTGEPRRITHPVASDVDYVAVTAALDPPEQP